MPNRAKYDGPLNAAIAGEMRRISLVIFEPAKAKKKKKKAQTFVHFMFLGCSDGHNFISIRFVSKNT